jgi:hypothetical protein
VQPGQVPLVEEIMAVSYSNSDVPEDSWLISSFVKWCKIDNFTDRRKREKPLLVVAQYEIYDEETSAGVPIARNWNVGTVKDC